jgi:steroid delta-isomerase-like uncharacterized protein
MSDTNKAIVRRLYEEVFEGGHLDLADELVAADCRDYGDPQDRRGPGRVKEVATMLKAAFSDQHWEILELIAEHDRVVMHSTISGTHSGPFMGIPPTGRAFSGVHHVYIFGIQDGRIADHQAVRDDITLMRQLGLIPSPPSPTQAATHTPAGPTRDVARTGRDDK